MAGAGSGATGASPRRARPRRGGEHRRRGDQPERRGQVVAVGQPGGQRARIASTGVRRRGAPVSSAATSANTSEPRRAERGREVRRQVVEEALEQQVRPVLDSAVRPASSSTAGRG